MATFPKTMIIIFTLLLYKEFIFGNPGQLQHPPVHCLQMPPPRALPCIHKMQNAYCLHHFFGNELNPAL